VAEKRNIGMIAMLMKSKSMNERMKVVAPSDAPAKPKPMSTAAGMASTPHHDSTRPITVITTRNAVA
jgi:hypothetical protein